MPSSDKTMLKSVIIFEPQNVILLYFDAGLCFDEMTIEFIVSTSGIKQQMTFQDNFYNG